LKGDAASPYSDGLLITEAVAPADVGQAKRLIIEYAQTLGIDLSFQAFEHELAVFPGAYSAPHGLVLLGWVSDQPAGCVCLRPLDDERVCEMKRLYVRPAYRGRAIGRRLAQAAIHGGRRLGYEAMRLDTLSSMTEAISLYGSLGFRPIDPYYANPIESAQYFELDLQ
jgi:ribosomal protein S18 acetylase RimI-like enzyme